MKLYIVRHGETDWNKASRIQGRADIVLNKYGRELAEITGKALSHVEFDYAITSPLKRAKETAMLIVGGQQTPVICDERIMEIDFGKNEGLYCGDGGYELGDNFKKFFTTPEAYEPAEGGESIQSLLVRTKEFVEELTQKSRQESTSGAKVLISTHGGVLAALLLHFKKETIENLWKDGVHKNCAVTTVEIKDGGAYIIEEGKIFY